ncbi:nucleotidyltransferase [Nonomuraea sp. NPDC050643]|uniref:nucleotidyltransferase domain-containing protein n=1 Tax=Nonomuraea sp. NPDC050643 TaxID=3155660 RepID=UPI003400F96B
METKSPKLDTLSGMLSDLINGAVEVLDISPHLDEIAVARYEEVGAWLADNGGINWRIYPQGSFLLGTVVRPDRPTGEYDIDSVCWLPLAKENISQEDLKDRVGDHLAAYRRWKIGQGHTDGPLRIESKRRCWQLVYTGFHLDVLPAIADVDHPPTGILLTDKDLVEWQHSNPRGYATWFREQARPRRALEAKGHPSVADVPAWPVRTTLQRVVQVLKWHKMIMFGDDPDNRPPSILVTTLAARAYQDEVDLFTALRQVLDGMPRFITQHDGIWWVPNPAHEEENFTDKWKEYPERREAFYQWFDEIRRLVDELAAMEGEGYRQVFTRLTESFDRKAMHTSVERVAARIGESSGDLRLGRTGRLSPTATGPRTGGNTFYGQHPAPRG